MTVCKFMCTLAFHACIHDLHSITNKNEMAHFTLPYQVGQKTDPTCFCQNFVKSPPNLIIFGIQRDKTINNVRCTQ